MITAAEQPDLGERGTSVFLKALSATERDFVAVGELGGLGAMAWVSEDGYRWTRAESLAATKDSRMLDVRLGHLGYLAVGADAGAAAIWLSGDGRSWTRGDVADGDGVVLQRVSGWVDRFAAIGAREDDGMETAGVWSSADGSAWKMLPSSGALDGTAHAIAAYGDRLVVAGERLDDYGEWRAVAWISQDGLEWAAMELPAPPSSGIRDVLSVADELFAVGYQLDETGLAGPAAWHFQGQEWHAADVPGANEGRDVMLTSIAAGEAGIMAVGPARDGSIGIWTTSDGLAWNATETLGALGSPDTLGTYEAADVLVTGLQRTVVGWYPRQDPGHTWSGAVWTSPAPPDGLLPSAGSEPTVCPAGGEPELIAVIELEPATRVECFGDRELRFIAHLEAADVVDLTGEPSWLLGAAGLILSPVEGGQHVGGAAMAAYPEPELVIEDAVFEHRWHVVSGHFRDQRSGECRPAPGVELSAEGAISRCRERFVVTDLQPTEPPY